MPTHTCTPYNNSFYGHTPIHARASMINYNRLHPFLTMNIVLLEQHKVQPTLFPGRNGSFCPKLAVERYSVS